MTVRPHPLSRVQHLGNKIDKIFEGPADEETAWFLCFGRGIAMDPIKRAASVQENSRPALVGDG